MVVQSEVQQSRLALLLPLAAFVAALFGVKLWLVQAYGNATPYWDQWDAQAANLYAPFLNGQLGWRELLSAHNEHRIFTTRVLSLALLAINSLWNPLLEMVVNAALHALALALAAWFLYRSIGRMAWPALLAFALLVFGIPYGWENTLAGFQSQFYFVLLFSVLALWLLVTAPAFSWRWWGGLAAAALGYFSLASGVFALAAVVVTLLVRCAWISRDKRELWAAVLLGACFFLGVWGTPVIAGHAPLKASGAAPFFAALAKVLHWPLVAEPASALPWLWALLRNLPWLVAVGLLLRRRAGRNDPIWFLLAAGVWIAGQSLSVAYGRVETVLSSRYLDLHAMSLLLNLAALLWLCKRAPARLAAPLPVLVAASWLAFVTIPLVDTAASELPAALAGKRAISAIQESNLQSYLASGDRAKLRAAAFLHLPYPDADRLATIVDSPVLRPILPRNLQVPAASPAGGPVAAGRLDAFVTMLLASWPVFCGAGLALALACAFLTMRPSSKFE